MTDQDILKILQNDVAQATAKLSTSHDQLPELFRDGTILQGVDPNNQSFHGYRQGQELPAFGLGKAPCL